MLCPGTLFHRRQRGIPMHSYENRSEIRALRPPVDNIAPTVHTCTQLHTSVHNVMLYQLYTT
jgi:hypothetical protein